MKKNYNFYDCYVKIVVNFQNSSGHQKEHRCHLYCVHKFNFFKTVSSAKRCRHISTKKCNENPSQIDFSLSMYFKIPE